MEYSGVLLFDIEIRSFSSTQLLHFCSKQYSYLLSLSSLPVGRGCGLFRVGGVASFYFYLFTFFSHYYKCYCGSCYIARAHIDICKLKWILLFSTYQCAALGILSERTRDSLHCKGMLLGASLCGTFLL